MGSLRVSAGGGTTTGGGGGGGGKGDRDDGDVDDEVAKEKMGGGQVRKDDPAPSTRMFRVATDGASSDGGGGRQGLDGRLARLRRAQRLLERSGSSGSRQREVVG